MSSGTLAASVPLSPLDPWIAAKIGGAGRLLSADALAAYQLARLNDTLQLARTRSAFYRRRLHDTPGALDGPDELSRLPFTEPGEIRDNPLGFLCVSQDEIARVVTLDTSGTTGRPKRLYFTAADQELTLDFFRTGMATFTTPGDRVLILLPVARPGSVGDLLAIALARLGATGIRHGPVTDVIETIDALARERATGVVGVPAQVLALARHPASRGIKLDNALLTTDYVPASLARAVESAWGCTVYNHYGMTEMGLGGGVECQARRGYHVREADLLFEVVDPQTGKPLPEGETGEVVFTTLTRRGMPLIRYRTGDLSRFIPGSCACGTALRTLARVEGRIANRAAIGAGDTLTLAELDEALFAVPGITDFSATLKRGMPDQLRIDARVAPGASPRGTLETALLDIEAIRHAIQSRSLAIKISVSAQAPDTPPPPAKRVLADLR